MDKYNDVLIYAINNMSHDEISNLILYLKKIQSDKKSQPYIPPINDPLKNPQYPQNMQYPQHSHNSFLDRQLSSCHVDHSNDNSWKNSTTRSGKKTALSQVQNPVYHNPYEYGTSQTMLDSQYLEPFNGPYHIDIKMVNNSGLTPESIMDGNNNMTRNINVENKLLYQENTRVPGQKSLLQQETNRFTSLPFNPQNPSNIVWKDDMPRNGIATRNERLDY